MNRFLDNNTDDFAFTTSVDKSIEEVSDKDMYILSLENKLRTVTADIKSKEEQIASLNQGIKDKQGKISKLKSNIEEKKKEVCALEESIKGVNQIISKCKEFHYGVQSNASTIATNLLYQSQKDEGFNLVRTFSLLGTIGSISGFLFFSFFVDDIVVPMSFTAYNVSAMLTMYIYCVCSFASVLGVMALYSIAKEHFSKEPKNVELPKSCIEIDNLLISAEKSLSV